MMRTKRVDLETRPVLEGRPARRFCQNQSRYHVRPKRDNGYRRRRQVTQTTMPGGAIFWSQRDGCVPPATESVGISLERANRFGRFLPTPCKKIVRRVCREPPCYRHTTKEMACATKILQVVLFVLCWQFLARLLPYKK